MFHVLERVEDTDDRNIRGRPYHDKDEPRIKSRELERRKEIARSTSERVRLHVLGPVRNASSALNMVLWAQNKHRQNIGVPSSKQLRFLSEEHQGSKSSSAS